MRSVASPSKRSIGGRSSSLEWAWRRSATSSSSRTRTRAVEETRRRPDAGQDHVAGRAAPKVVKPAGRRAVVGHLRAAYRGSERRARHATGFGRSSQRYRSRRDPQTELRMRLRSEEHTSELQSLMRNSYAVFCFKK